MAEWVEGKYGFHRCKVGRFTLIAHYDGMGGGGYKATVCGFDLKSTLNSIDEAKAKAVDVARKLLTEALADLDTL